MTVTMIEIAVGALAPDHIWVVLRHTYSDWIILLFLVVVEEIRVKNVWFLLLINGIVEFEDLSADDLVVSVQDGHYLAVITVFMSRIIYVF
jgi:hypothetical protein